MGTPNAPKPVRYFVSLIYRENGQMPGIEDKLITLLGEIASRTNPVTFLHTNYYEKEMGKSLLRYFLLFKPLRDREELSSVKLATNDIETNTLEEGRRTINIDPGYIALEHVILATTKGFAHRIYLGKGIFGDLTLMYSEGAFKPLPWTYPDYGSSEMISLLKCWREEYKGDLRGGSVSEKSPRIK
jgi:Domain of unknown function (DUF4416)